jgi:hypothetical protein
MLNLINIGSAVATRRILVNPVQRTNIRGLMAERFRVHDLCTEGYRFVFMCNFFSILSPFFSSIDFF